MPRKLEINAVAITAAAIGLGAVFADWFHLKANRLLTGDGLSYFDSLGLWLGLVLIALWLATLTAALFSTNRFARFAMGILAIATLMVVLIGSGAATGRILETATELARVSPSGGFWLSALAAYLLFFASTRPSMPLRLGVTGAWPLIIVLAVTAGWLNDFSFMVEYQTQHERFIQELWQHLAIFGVSLGAAAFIGLPLGIWAARGKAAKPVLYVLGIIQTVPSLALFGLLLVTLAALRDALPALGISAIGFLPAVIAITLYSLLPIAQHTYSGLKAVDPDIKDAAAGLGMNPRQLLLRVELPLAGQAIVSGLRIAAVQAVGGTTVAALIGAGGLGFFIFQGLGQAAADLILLGAIAVVVLAIMVNAVFQFAEERLKTPGAAGA